MKLTYISQIQWHGKLHLRTSEDTMFLDIETDPDGRIWLIGVQYKFQLHQFVAAKPQDEVTILNQFKDLLDNNPNSPLLCYSRTYFYFRILVNRAKALDTDLVNSMLNRPWIDLCIELRKVSSAPSYKLKRLAKVYEYPLSHELDGYLLSNEYQEMIRRNGCLDRAFMEIALEYNADDIMLLPFLLIQFGENVEEMDPVEDVAAEIIRQWIIRNKKLIHTTATEISLYFSLKDMPTAHRYLTRICIPQRVKTSQYHVSFTWKNFGKLMVEGFLTLFE